MAVEKMHNRQIKMGKCTCPEGSNSPLSSSTTIDHHHPSTDVNEADDEGAHDETNNHQSKSFLFYKVKTYNV